MRDVRAHEWMQGVDWEKVRSEQLTSPFIPDVGYASISSAFSSSLLYLQTQKANFDVTHELDEFMMVEKPLTHHKRKKANMDPEKMKPEMRQLEEQYVVSYLALYISDDLPA